MCLFRVCFIFISKALKDIKLYVMKKHYPIIFIVYHTQLSDEGVKQIGEIYPKTDFLDWAKRWDDFQKNFLPFVSDYIDVLFQSAKVVHPDCQCVILSDYNTKFKGDLEKFVVRYDLEPDKPAYFEVLNTPSST